MGGVTSVMTHLNRLYVETNRYVIIVRINTIRGYLLARCSLGIVETTSPI